jgi:hypothetical protein
VADQQILQYIITQERAGYGESQIRAALASQGHQQQQIDAAFKELQTAQIDPVIHEYVQQYARQGSTPVQIFKTLTEQGYAPGKVRRSIIDVFGPGTLPTHHTAVFFVIALVIAAGGIYFLQASLLHPAPDNPTSGNTIEFSASDMIGQVIAIARTQGGDAGVKECQLRLRNDDRDRCLLDVAILENVNDSTICDQVVDARIKDTCLLNFMDADREGICKRVQLQESIEVCNAVKELKRTAAT